MELAITSGAYWVRYLLPCTMFAPKCAPMLITPMVASKITRQPCMAQAPPEDMADKRRNSARIAPAAVAMPSA